MKLVRFNGGRIGLLQDGHVYDATDAAGVDPSAWPPIGMLQIIANFDALRSKLERALARDGFPLERVRLDAPLVWPQKLWPTRTISRMGMR
jgi:hypothetical protein